MSIFRNKSFTTVSLGHLAVDILNSQRPVLLAYLSGPLGLTNSFVGLVSTIYLFGNSLILPFFGYLADRIGIRWIVAGGVFWMAGFFSLAVMVPGDLALVFLVIASLGSAAVHPAGAMQATLTGSQSPEGKETTAASYFFLFGQLGFFLGPLLGGPILNLWGPVGLMVIIVATLPIGTMAVWNLPGKMPHKPELVMDKAGSKSQTHKTTIRAVVLITLLALTQAWAAQNITTFLPKYLADLGRSPSSYGFMAAIYMAGSAAGNLGGGRLSDRFGKRKVILFSMGSAIVPFYILSRIGYSPWLILIIPMIGFLTGSAYIAIVVLAQRLFPSGMALASGLVLGFIFSSAAVGTIFSGMVADRWGISSIYIVSSGLVLIGTLAAIGLRPEQGYLQPIHPEEPVLGKTIEEV